jgi:hypothetical protein
MDDSIITFGPGGTSFCGEDGVRLYRATALKVALTTYAKYKMRMGRAWTPTVMLNMATGITGKTYKRGQYELAAADVQGWIDAMKAAIPVEVRS